VDREHEAEILEDRRRSAYAMLGTVSEDVVSRLVPSGQFWPDSPLGKMLLVRRDGGVLIATSGLSNFYDLKVHPRPPPAPLDYELCLDVRVDDPRTESDAALARSWLPSLLYPLADFASAEWVDVRGMLTQFRAITLGAPPLTREAQSLADDDGLVGYLIGLPLSGADLDLHFYLNGFYRDLGRGLDECAIGIFPVKPLTADEYHYAKHLGNDGGVWLAEAFLKRGDGAQHWTGRPSVLVQPSLF
jgi:hypothetical protein